MEAWGRWRRPASVPVRAVLDKGRGVLAPSRPRETTADIFPLRMTNIHSGSFKVTLCGHQPFGLHSQAPCLPHPIPEHTHQLCRRQGLTG